MQPHCNLALMCLSAGALRDVGGWAGPIYVITDHPASLLTHCEVGGSSCESAGRHTCEQGSLVSSITHTCQSRDLQFAIAARWGWPIMHGRRQ